MFFVLHQPQKRSWAKALKVNNFLSFQTRMQFLCSTIIVVPFVCCFFCRTSAIYDAWKEHAKQRHAVTFYFIFFEFPLWCRHNAQFILFSSSNMNEELNEFFLSKRRRIMWKVLVPNHFSFSRENLKMLVLWTKNVTSCYSPHLKMFLCRLFALSPLKCVDLALADEQKSCELLLVGKTNNNFLEKKKFMNTFSMIREWILHRTSCSLLVS